jgi:hypothetical protein
MRRAAPLRGWVLYDGACGFCSRWIPLWRPVLGSRWIFDAGYRLLSHRRYAFSRACGLGETAPLA